MILSLFCCLLVVIAVSVATRLKVRGCHYLTQNNWGRDDIGQGYMPEYYEPDLCTHIFFSFWSSQARTYEFDNVLYNNLRVMKRKQLDLKVLLSVKESNQFQFRSRRYRREFIESVIDIMVDYEADGVNIDWEWKDSYGDPKKNLVHLLTELNKELKAFNPQLLLTITGTANQTQINRTADVLAIDNVVDFVNVMSFDLNNDLYDDQDKWFTRHNSPLFSESFSIENSVHFWINAGLSKSKTVVGLASFGRRFEMERPIPKVTGLGIKITSSNYLTSYLQACKAVASGAKRTYDSESQSPYYVKGQEWVSYDDPQSIEAKVKWIKNQGYIGAFFFALSYDDFKGECKSSDRKYPLISLMNMGDDQSKFINETEEQTTDVIRPNARMDQENSNENSPKESVVFRNETCTCFCKA